MVVAEVTTLDNSLTALVASLREFHNGEDAERAQAGAGNLVSLVIGIAVAVIVGVGVAIPVVNDVLAQSNITGLTATIVGFIPVMLGVLIFVATVGPIMTRT